jgi:hypothetical protein
LAFSPNVPPTEIEAESGETVIEVKVAVEVTLFEPPPPHPARINVKIMSNLENNLTAV